MTQKIVIFSLLIVSILFFDIMQVYGTETIKPGQSYKDQSLDEQIEILAEKILARLRRMKKKLKVAVTDFPDIDGRVRKLSKYISEELITKLHNSDDVKVIERSKLDKIMKEQELSSSSLFDEKTTQRLGKLLGANVIVTGTLTDLGSYIKVNARVVSVRTGEIIAVSQVKVNKTQTVNYLWTGRRTSYEQPTYKEQPREEPKKTSEPRDNSHKDPTFIIGIKGTIPFTFYTSGTSNLAFLDSFKDGTAEGIGIGGGLFFEIIPFKYFAFESGINYRTFSLGGADVTFSEFQIPLIAKLRLPVNNKVTVSIGAGVSYFNQFSGKVDPDGDGPGQKPISMEKNDLKDGFSFIAKFGIQIQVANFGLACIDVGYERAKRSLNIITNDLFISFGFGFIVF